MKPILLIGHKGVTDNVVAEAEAALLAHELFKVKFHDNDVVAAGAIDLAARAECELVAVVGNIVILYRAHPDTPRIRLPRQPKQGVGSDHLAAGDDDGADEDGDVENDDSDVVPTKRPSAKR